LINEIDVFITQTQQQTHSHLNVILTQASYTLNHVNQNVIKCICIIKNITTFEENKKKDKK